MADEAAATVTAAPETVTAQPSEQEQPAATLIYHRGYRDTRAIREALDEYEVRYRVRDVYNMPLSREEVRALLEGHADLRPFLNPRSTEYRDRRMGENPPSLELAVELIEREPTLLQLPVLVRGEDVAVVTEPEPAFQLLGIDTKKIQAAKKAAAKAAAAAAKKPAADKPVAAKKEPAAEATE